MSALASLILEEGEIQDQIRILQAKLERIQAAKEQIESVHEGRIANGGGSYSNLTARNAIRMYLKEQGKPLTAPEIARGILERGFKSNAKNFVNVVGVNLRQYEGKDFERESENRWTLA